MFQNSPLLFINLRAAHTYQDDRAPNRILPSRKIVSLQKRGVAHKPPCPQSFIYSEVTIKVAIYSKSGTNTGLQVSNANILQPVRQVFLAPQNA